jgi:hypothetical protein
VQYMLVRDVREHEEREEGPRPGRERPEKQHGAHPKESRSGCCTCRAVDRTADPALGNLGPILDNLSRQLEQTSGRLHSMAQLPASHQNCEVHAVLVEEDSRVQNGVEEWQREMRSLKKLTSPNYLSGGAGHERRPLPDGGHEGKGKADRHVHFEE